MRRLFTVMALALLVLLPALGFGQGTVAPAPFQTVFDNSGKIASGAKVSVYAAGTSNLVTSYQDAGLTTPNTNPIVADSAGRFVAFLSPGSAYKFVYQTSSGVTLRTVDNVQAMPGSAGNVDATGTAGEALSAGSVVYLSDGTGGKTAGMWYQADATNAYSSTVPIVGVATGPYSQFGAGTFRIAGRVTVTGPLVVGATYYVASTPGQMTATAPANIQALGAADTPSSLILSSARGSSVTVVTKTDTGTLNDWAPGISGSTVIRLNNASALSIQGLSSVGVSPGTRVTLLSVGAGHVYLVHENGGSSAANRLTNFATTGTTPLAAGLGSAEYVYDGTASRWRLVQHSQGAPISFTPTVAGSGGMTITSLAINTAKYYLMGRVVRLYYNLSFGTSGTPGLVTVAANPYTLLAATEYMLVRVLDNGSYKTGLCNTNPSTQVNCSSDLTGIGTWANSASNSSLIAMLTFEVQ